MVQQFRIYSLTSKERFDESVTEHTNIIQNILSGNAREADRINRTHLELAREKIIVYLNKKMLSLSLSLKEGIFSINGKILPEYRSGRNQRSV